MMAFVFGSWTQSSSCLFNITFFYIGIIESKYPNVLGLKAEARTKLRSEVIFGFFDKLFNGFPGCKCGNLDLRLHEIKKDDYLLGISGYLPFRSYKLVV